MAAVDIRNIVEYVGEEVIIGEFTFRVCPVMYTGRIS